MADQPQQNINIKVTDEVLKGLYANNVQVSFTNEEFILDFMNLFPPQGVLNARVIVNPGHAKRIASLLADTVKKYEEQFGQVKGQTPQNPVSTSESSKFGF